MKTNTKKVSQKIQKYIFDTINIKDSNADEKTMLQTIVDSFNNEYVFEYNLRRYKTYQNLFISWMQGLPSQFSVNHAYHDILQDMESFGLPQPENKNNSESSDLFYRLIYREFTKLLNKYDIELIK